MDGWPLWWCTTEEIHSDLILEDPHRFGGAFAWFLSQMLNLRIVELDLGQGTRFGCNQVDPSSIQRHLAVGWEFAQVDGQILPKQERQISFPGWARISLPRWASLLGKERVSIPTKRHSCWARWGKRLALKPSTLKVIFLDQFISFSPTRINFRVWRHVVLMNFTNMRVVVTGSCGFQKKTILKIKNI